MRKKSCYLFLLLVGLFANPSTGHGEEEPLTISSVEGKVLTPLKSEGGLPAVLIFVATDCPVANGYVPELNRIFDAYTMKGVNFTVFHPDPGTSDESALNHAREYAIKLPVAVDRMHRFVGISGVTTTPEVALFGGDGKLIYRGRIDDRYSDYGDRKPKASIFYLRDALDAVLAGKPVRVSRTEALGCLIEPLSVPVGKNSGD